jgi:hypothetical protein
VLSAERGTRRRIGNRLGCLRQLSRILGWNTSFVWNEENEFKGLKRDTAVKMDQKMDPVARATFFRTKKISS